MTTNNTRINKTIARLRTELAATERDIEIGTKMADAMAAAMIKDLSKDDITLAVAAYFTPAAERVAEMQRSAKAIVEEIAAWEAAR